MLPEVADRRGSLRHSRLYPTEAGVPQGGICSPVIANLRA